MGNDEKYLQLQLHLFEYQAITTRCTYWITLQFALGPLMFLYLGLAAQAPRSINRALVMSFSVLVVQGIMLILSYLVAEQYHAVNYVNTKLRRMVESLNVNEPFWHYDQSVKATRKTGPHLWEWAIVVLPLLAFCGAGELTRESASIQVWDWIGTPLNIAVLVVNVVVFGVLIWRFYRVITIRKRPTDMMAS